MHIAILTFDGFNELDSLIAYGMLSRISLLGDRDWRVSIASPTPRVTSMNGLTIDAHIDLQQACAADAVLIGSGRKTREVADTPEIMAQLQFDPARQLLGAQCSGTFLLARLGLLGDAPACTDATSKPWVQAAGVNVVNQAFYANGNIATAGGCLAAQYLSAWFLARLKGTEAAREVLHNFAPVGEKDDYVARAFAHIEASL
ncbi:AraC family transcriptional regulator [Pseudomonas sp. ADAK2]|uniref:DJ-1/PfpI family protein n=1 Tax=unclassified Pseudomonas TaxID=196821 RepID=UPI00146317DA|nr:MULTISPECIES: DJ-1/PfpI family protein [unclassified Pseudomonas]QJI39619.1 AraC family transcriptional regulator [Pseudomonas sp. ADAK7]QJI45925.1 AraC family transcriptional regulator [Pseudomonas sp. ADAK2]